MIFTEAQKEEIYREYQNKVFGYIRSKINDSTTAEDLTADVFLKVYSKLDEFDDSKASVSTWIFTITRNTLTDYYRTRRVYEEIPETLEEEGSIEEDVCNADMLEKLAYALTKLDEREREIIVGRYYSGKTLKEIADCMDISYAYVKVLQNKALSELKKYL